MHSVIALANSEVGLQLRLAGVPVIDVTDADEAIQILLRYLDGLDAAQIILVDETLRERFPERIHKRIREHRGLPLILFCPSFETDESDVDALLAELLKPAIGYEIRLE
ncbi:MAG TPA: V-type ATP synthase subunit F [Candidatus Hydrogenedentes bacterium]|nr:V-type ATP synthase subunit F [Candidatus Hydrogenedentota bacterium]HOL76324.1 V-type ATP synthase subunit F [Candidatus Hydrogenedentota bacterium]HPO86152.1 V-type ATP synthase subunit F [Candidatus Hydrogenedentota bacterium]